MADITRLVRDLNADDGYELNRQHATEAATLIEDMAARLKLLSDYRYMLRTEGGDWKADLVSNDLSSILEDTL